MSRAPLAPTARRVPAGGPPVGGPAVDRHPSGTRRRSAPRRRASRRAAGHLALNLLTLLVTAVMLFPVAWMVLASLQTNQGLLTGDVDLAHPRWENYLEMWRNIQLALFFRNSLLVCGATTLLATLLATTAGYALARFRFPGADLFGMTVIATQLIPGIMFLIPLYLLFLWMRDRLGIPLLNTFPGMILVYTAFFTPASIWIMRGFFARLPRELEEAALLDGCTRWQAFWRVILPLSAPGLVATAVYIFLAAWDELLFAWVLAGKPEVQTLPVGIRLYVGQFQNRYDLLMAAGTAVSLPVLLAFLASQRYLIKGLTAGAIKG